MEKVDKKAVAVAGNHREELLDELVERAKPYVRESLAQWLEQILGQTVSKASSTHPFHLTFKEFVKLSEDAQRAWRHQVLDLEEDWLAEQLARRNAEWLLVVGGKVAKSSSNLERLPTKKEIYRIAKARGFAPLLFIKDILIEESGIPLGSSLWSRISANDHYPTITLYIGKASWQDTQVISYGKKVVADFDTGCPAVLIDEDEIDTSILGRVQLESSGRHLGRHYDYRACSIKVAVLTKDANEKETEIIK